MAESETSQQLENSVERADRVDVSDLVRRYESYARNTQENRQLQLRDWQYYHDKQYTREELEVFRARKQPPIVFNRIKPKINFIRGFETKTRIDPRVLPRNQTADTDSFAATDALRYASDVSKFDSVRSRVLFELLVPGCGGGVLGVDDDLEITLTPVRADRFFYDVHSIEPDFSDASFLGVVVWWNYEDIIKEAKYADRRQVIDETMSDAAGAEGWAPHEDKPAVWNDGVRKRIRVVEMYYKDLGPKVDRDGNEMLDDNDEPIMGPEWYVCHFTKAGALIDPKIIPWRDDKGHTFCPLVATSAFVDEENNRYGFTRSLICPQDEVNKRRQVALRQSMHQGFMYEPGAVEDPDETATELTKPDSKIVVREGALKDKTFQLIDSKEMHQSQFMLYQDAKAEIDNVGPSLPVTAGAGDNRMSGRAILAKQNIGSMELGTLFDNLRMWGKTVHERMWYMVRSLWTQDKWLRVRDSVKKEGYRFIRLNGQMTRAERLLGLVQGDEVPLESAIMQLGLEPWVSQRLLAEAQQMARMQAQQFMQVAMQAGQQLPPEMLQQQMPQLVLAAVLQAPFMQEIVRTNDIGAVDVDIIIDETPDTSIAAQEEFLELMEMLSKGVFTTPPHIQKALVESSNVRNKENILQAIDRPPDPAVVQMQQQQMQMQMQQMQMQLQQMAAMVQKAQADAAYSAARAQDLSQRSPVEVQMGMHRAHRDHAAAQKLEAETQLNVPAQAEKDLAAAEKLAAEARDSVPTKAHRDMAAAAKDATQAHTNLVQGVFPK